MTQPKFAPFEIPLSVPLALSSRKNWIGWRLVHDPDDPDNPKKMPVVLVLGVPVNDYLKPHAHVTYDEALAQVEPLRLAGVGFVMTLDCGMIGGDMDGCRDPVSGVIEPWAQRIIDRKETYFEISPSGRGVRFFSLTDIPLRETILFKPAGVELYSKLRYLTFTGNRILGTPLEVQRAPYAVETLMRRVADAKAAAKASKATASPSKGQPDPTGAEAFRRKVYDESPMGKINKAAMNDFDAWVPELFPSARKDGTGKGYRVSSVELGRPLQEDLALHPEGIKDFGVHDLGDPREGGRSPIDIVMEWSDATPKMDARDAADWLVGRLGIPDPFLDAASAGASTVEPPDPGPLVPLPFVPGRKLPAREWLVDGWVPMNKVTLLQGDGGDGKTLLTHQLQASAATGLTWIGLAVQPVVSCGFYTEDDAYDVDERQEAIDLAYGAECCTAGHALHRFPRADEDSELVVFDRARRPVLTKFYGRMVEAVRDLGARLLVLDVAVDLFGGNEIVRPEVRALFRPLGRLARDMAGAVVMSTHVSQSGIRTDGGHSGSTDWSNAARSRLYLNRPKDDRGNLLDPDARVLTRKKSNYAALGDRVDLRWERGVLVPLGGQSAAAGAFRRPVEDVFMDILDAVTAEGHTVSHKSKSGTYAPSVMTRRPSADRGGYGRVDFERAMHTLLKAGRVVIVGYGKPSNPLEKLARNTIIV